MLFFAVLLMLCVLFTGCDDASENGGEQTPGGASEETESNKTPGGASEETESNKTPQTPKKDITGITFEDSEVTYNGTEHSILVSGTLPTGVGVTYSNHKATDAGSYAAVATLTGEGYNTLTLSATLTVKKATVSGITFSDKTVVENGAEQSILIEGTLPLGVTVTYENNVGLRQGTYNATATLTGKNYETVQLTAVLTVKPDLTMLAGRVVESLLTVPDIWEFLPQSLLLENLGYVQAPSADFASGFVPVENIPVRVVGKQLNVVYDTLYETEALLSYLRTVMASAEVITTLYQNFINQNPDDFAEFTDTTGDFRFHIKLSDGNYLLLVELGTVNLELAYNAEESIGTGRIQLSDTNVLKYEMGEDHLKVAVSVAGISLTQLEFVRTDGVVVGYLYEYLGTESKNLKTSALVRIDESYTTIISNKRESDDLTVEGDVEIYSNATGELIGTQIKETVGTREYDTKWLPLCAVNGFESIKVLPQQNGLNADTVYINGSDTAIETMIVSLLNPSRRFDIEMKTVYIYVFDIQKEKYQKQKIEIPMLFVQSEQFESFTEDFFEKNEDCGMNEMPTFTFTGAVHAYISGIYGELLPAYLEIKELVSYSSIVADIGEKNAFFENA